MIKMYLRAGKMLQDGKLVEIEVATTTATPAAKLNLYSCCPAVSSSTGSSPVIVE